VARREVVVVVVGAWTTLGADVVGTGTVRTVVGGGIVVVSSTTDA
jgi:hypothetical protein